MGEISTFEIVLLAPKNVPKVENFQGVTGKKMEFSMSRAHDKF